MTAEQDNELLAALPIDGTPIGVRELARSLGRTTTQVGRDCERLLLEGRLLLERPAGGYRSGQRTVRRDGESLPVLKARLEAVTTERDLLRAGINDAVAILLPLSSWSPR